MKKYTLFPKIQVPKVLSRVLAYIVMGFGAVVLVTGILVKDDMPAIAQNGEEITAPAAPTASIFPSNDIGAFPLIPVSIYATPSVCM